MSRCVRLVNNLKNVVIVQAVKPNEKNRNVRGQEALDLIRNSEVFVLDVRTEREYKGGALEGSQLIPVDQLQVKLAKNDLKNLPQKKETPILVYCAHGIRSVFAKSLLEKVGYTQVFNLMGGLAELETLRKN